MAEKKWQTFAPLPARAMADEALAALDIRVLACLAAHDRFGANGTGCYASHPRLAGLVKCHLKSLSRSLRVLADLGYIEASQHPLNKRLRVYRVVYNSDDMAVMKGDIGNDTVTDGEPDEDPIGNRPVPEDEPIGNQHFQEGEQYQEDAGLNIFREPGRILREPFKDNSAESASPNGDAKDSLGNEGRKGKSEHKLTDKAGQFLGKVQTWLKTLSHKQLTDEDIQHLRQVRDDCLRIEDDSEAHLGGIGGWAQRLGSDIDYLIEDPDDDDEIAF